MPNINQPKLNPHDSPLISNINQQDHEAAMEDISIMGVGVLIMMAGKLPTLNEAETFSSSNTYKETVAAPGIRKNRTCVGARLILIFDMVPSQVGDTRKPVAEVLSRASLLFPPNIFSNKATRLIGKD